MKKTTVTTYSFNELDEQAKEKAIEKYSDINTDYEWWEDTYNDAKEVGIKIVSFDTYRGEIDAQIIDSPLSAAELIKANHGEECETYKTAVEFIEDRERLINEAPKDEDGNPENESELDDILSTLENQFIYSIAQDYLIILRKDYEYRTSKEAIQESIEANEYQFFKDGSPENFLHKI